MRRGRLSLLLPLICVGLSGSAYQARPKFFFGGKPLYIGMSERAAVTALSDCCKLSPPLDANIESKPAPQGNLLGHFIMSNDPKERLLGTITFSAGEVVRISRPLDDNVNTYDEDVVAFARALKRSLPDGDSRILVTVKHEQISNAESDLVSFAFPDGREIELHIGTLDKANEYGKRDFATIEESLQ